MALYKINGAKRINSPFPVIEFCEERHRHRPIAVIGDSSASAVQPSLHNQLNSFRILVQNNVNGIANTLFKMLTSPSEKQALLNQWASWGGDGNALQWDIIQGNNSAPVDLISNPNQEINDLVHLAALNAPQGVTAVNSAPGYAGYSLVHVLTGPDDNTETGWALDTDTLTTLQDYLTGGNNPQDNGLTQQANYAALNNLGTWVPALPQPNTGTGFVGVPGNPGSNTPKGAGGGGVCWGGNVGSAAAGILSTIFPGMAGVWGNIFGSFNAHNSCGTSATPTPVYSAPPPPVPTSPIYPLLILGGVGLGLALILRK